jgi:hypothetical protein
MIVIFFVVGMLMCDKGMLYIAVIDVLYEDCYWLGF